MYGLFGGVAGEKLFFSKKKMAAQLKSAKLHLKVAFEQKRLLEQCPLGR